MVTEIGDHRQHSECAAQRRRPDQCCGSDDRRDAGTLAAYADNLLTRNKPEPAPQPTKVHRFHAQRVGGAGGGLIGDSNIDSGLTRQRLRGPGLIACQEQLADRYVANSVSAKLSAATSHFRRAATAGASLLASSA